MMMRVAAESKKTKMTKREEAEVGRRRRNRRLHFRPTRIDDECGGFRFVDTLESTYWRLEEAPAHTRMERRRKRTAVAALGCWCTQDSEEGANGCPLGA